MKNFAFYDAANGIEARILTILFLILATVFSTTSVWSQQATPTDRYKPASDQNIYALRASEKAKLLLTNAQVKMLVMEGEFTTNMRHVIVRFEDGNCGEWCINAVYESVISDDSFIAYVLLPRKSTRGDVWWRFCPTCKREFAIIFRADDGKGKSFMLTEHGIVF